MIHQISHFIMSYSWPKSYWGRKQAHFISLRWPFPSSSSFLQRLEGIAAVHFPTRTILPINQLNTFQIKALHLILQFQFHSQGLQFQFQLQLTPSSNSKSPKNNLITINTNNKITRILNAISKRDEGVGDDVIAVVIVRIFNVLDDDEGLDLVLFFFCFDAEGRLEDEEVNGMWMWRWGLIDGIVMRWTESEELPCYTHTLTVLLHSSHVRWLSLSLWTTMFPLSLKLQK